MNFSDYVDLIQNPEAFREYMQAIYGRCPAGHKLGSFKGLYCDYCIADNKRRINRILYWKRKDEK